MDNLSVLRGVATRLATGLSWERVSLSNELERAFLREGTSEATASDLAERLKGRLETQLEQLLQQVWDEFGIPRPLISSHTPGLYLGIRHKNYVQRSGARALPIFYPDVLQFVVEASAKELVGIVAITLFLSGCDPILITDGKGDGGVDVAGRMAHGILHGTQLFVQAKAVGRELGKRAVQTESKVFADGKQDGKVDSIIRSLGMNGQYFLSSGYLHLIVSSGGFRRSAQQYASNQNLILWNARQIAFMLCQRVDRTGLENLLRSLDPMTRSFSRNLAPLIEQHMVSAKARDDAMT